MSSYFGRRVSLGSASFIVVEKRSRLILISCHSRTYLTYPTYICKNSEAVVLANQGALVDWVRKTEKMLLQSFGYDELPFLSFF
jgi:hypothetical protein